MEEDNALSIADIFRIIFSQKWLALILAVAITVLGAVGIIGIYNPMVSVYSVKFSLNLPGNSDGAYYAYPDGYILYYNSLVSKSRLLDAKKSNEDEFSDIDIDKMVEKGKIAITSEVKSDAGSKESEGQFNITVKKSCFKNEDEARDFLKAVTEIPVDYFKTMPTDVYLHLQYNKTSVSYGTAVSNIKSQIEFLKNEYRSLMSDYGYRFIVDINPDAKQNKSLQSYLIEIDDYLDTGVIDDILTDIKTNGFVRNEAEKHKYELELEELENELAYANTALNNMMQVTVTDNPQAIKEQTDLVSELKKKEAVLNKYVKGGPSANIEKRIDNLYKDVEEFTDTYKTVLDAVYKKLSFVTYDDAKIITTVGGLGTVATAVISLAVGVFAALVIAYIVGLFKYKKKPKQSPVEPPAAVPYTSEPSEQDKI